MNNPLGLWRKLCHMQFLCLLAIYTFLGLTGTPEKLVPMSNDLLMHLGGYIVAGLSISFAWPRSAFWQRGLCLLGYSIAIEVGQHFLPPRTFSQMDILANFSGIVFGLVLFFLLKKIAPSWAQPLMH